MNKLIIALSLLAFSKISFADVDTTDLIIPDETVDSPSLNIGGKYQEKEVKLKELPKTKIVREEKRLTPSEMLRKRREQLEIRNQIMVQKKMEQIRLQQEIMLARKLEQSMNQTIQAIDNSLK